MPEIRLVVVDDHAPTREQVVKDLSSGDVIKIVGEAQTSDEALKISRELLPDVVLLDLHLPGLLSTMDLLKRLIVLRNVRVVMFGSLGKPSEVADLLDAGAALAQRGVAVFGDRENHGLVKSLKELKG